MTMPEINILYAQPDMDEDANKAIIEQILTRSNNQISFKGTVIISVLKVPLCFILTVLHSDSDFLPLSGFGIHSGA